MRFTLSALLLALLAPLPGQAQDTTVPPVAALVLDWNQDAAPDAVWLTRGSEHSADVHIRMGGADGPHPVLTIPGAVYFGSWIGQAPGLEALTDTSFAMTSEQTGHGPTPWMARVTVAFRNGGLMVTGYSHDYYDRLDPEHWGSCDVNLLTGEVRLSQGPGTGEIRDSDTPLDAPETQQTLHFAPAPFALTDLTDGYFPTACEALYH